MNNTRCYNVVTKRHVDVTGLQYSYPKVSRPSENLWCTHIPEYLAMITCLPSVILCHRAVKCCEMFDTNERLCLIGYFIKYGLTLDVISPVYSSPTRRKQYLTLSVAWPWSVGQLRWSQPVTYYLMRGVLYIAFAYDPWIEFVNPMAHNVGHWGYLTMGHI